MPVFLALVDMANPLNGQDVGSYSKPALGDLDGDGDLDLVAGDQHGFFRYYENTGSATLPAFVQRTGSANPLNGQYVASYSTPVLGDLDGDDDLDLVAGETLGTFVYYQNTGSATNTAFTLRTGSANPLNGQDAGGGYSAPALGDLEGDGDLDLVSGENFGTFVYYQNTGIGDYSITVHGDTDLLVETFQFVEHDGDSPHPGFFSLDGEPLRGQSAAALARVDGPIQSVTFEAVDLSVETLLAGIPLTAGHPHAASEDLSGTFNLPNEAFRVRVRGMDAQGFAFQRMVPQIVRPQVARVAVQPPVPETIPPDRVSTLQFSVQNTGPSAVFDITGRDHVQAVRPPELSLGSNGTATVDVDILPVSTPNDIAIRVTVDATVRGEPDLSNSATVELPEPGVVALWFGALFVVALKCSGRKRA